MTMQACQTGLAASEYCEFGSAYMHNSVFSARCLNIHNVIIKHAYDYM